MGPIEFLSHFEKSSCTKKKVIHILFPNKYEYTLSAEVLNDWNSNDDPNVFSMIPYPLETAKQDPDRALLGKSHQQKRMKLKSRTFGRKHSCEIPVRGLT